MLCSTCKSLDLSVEDFVIQASGDQDLFEHIHDLGSLQLIREKSSICALCRLIVDAVGGSHAPFSQQDNDIRCQLYWQEDGFFWGENEPKVRCLRVSAQPWPPSFNEFNRLIALADDTPDLDGLFLGRRIKETPISIKRIKQWMKLCQKWHGEDCEQLSTSLDWEFPSNFRVIDAWDRRIVQAPQGCKFLALSYVWGTVKVFKLLKDNLPKLEGKGALNKVWQDLPKTIQDAIRLTSWISIRYVWIDSLCILQDDSSDKNSLIPYMHKIYDRAFMTIVAASGKDAQAGLPGVCPKSRRQEQRVEEISPGLRLICPKHIVDALNHSVYESRAWTYQESCLSRRCLFFFDGQVSFRCRCALWREDVYLENVEVQTSFDMTFKHSISGTTAVGEPHSDYIGSLYEYSSRRLTYESDMLNAFAGVLGVLCERMSNGRRPELDHAYGLPTYIFDWALLWQPNISARRKSNMWPSWSWCGWTGTTSMALNGLDFSQLKNWLRCHTWINWIIYDVNGQPLVQMPSESTYQRDKQVNVRFEHLNSHLQISPASAHKVHALMRFYSSSSSPSSTRACSQLLHLATLSLCLRLIPTFHLVHDPESSLSSRSYIIQHRSTSQTSMPYGTIWLSTTWLHDPDPERTYEFLVLSEAPRKSVVKNEFPPREFTSRSESEVEAEWAAYFVMLIERGSQSGEEVFERVGLGAVYREAIDSELPAFILGGLTSVGGVIGYARTGSVPSIVAGLTVGALQYGLGGYRIQRKQPYGIELALLASVILAGSSIPRAIRLGKPLPIGLSVLATTGLLVYGRALLAARG
ncbi:hypothetical protein DV736_g3502, partial [Chaetothyriales sp. CBS 134916]